MIDDASRIVNRYSRARPIPEPLEKERGVWVFRTGQPMTAAETQEMLRQIREPGVRRGAGDAR